MFDRFTNNAREAMGLAREEAHRFGHHYIGTEHVLLGLIRQTDSSAALVLQGFKVNAERVRPEVDLIVQRGPTGAAVVPLPLTPRCKQVLVLAQEEANTAESSQIGTEHLLLGVLAENEGVGAQVLLKLGLKLEEVRAQVMGHSDDPPKTLLRPITGKERIALRVLIGSRCATIRKELGLSQREVARQLDMSASWVREYENGTQFAPAWLLAILAEASRHSANRRSVAWFYTGWAGGPPLTFQQSMDYKVIKQVAAAGRGEEPKGVGPPDLPPGVAPGFDPHVLRRKKETEE